MLCTAKEIRTCLRGSPYNWRDSLPAIYLRVDLFSGSTKNSQRERIKQNKTIKNLLKKGEGGPEKKVLNRRKKWLWYISKKITTRSTSGNRNQNNFEISPKLIQKEMIDKTTNKEKWCLRECRERESSCLDVRIENWYCDYKSKCRDSQKATKHYLITQLCHFCHIPKGFVILFVIYLLSHIHCCFMHNS